MNRIVPKQDKVNRALRVSCYKASKRRPLARYTVCFGKTCLYVQSQLDLPTSISYMVDFRIWLFD